MDINLKISLDENFANKVDKLLDLLTVISEKSIAKKIETEPVGAVPKAKTIKDDVVEVDNAPENKTETENATELLNWGVNTVIPATKKASKEDVIKSLQSLAKKNGKAAASELLHKYSATKVSELDENNYDDLVADVERVI